MRRRPAIILCLGFLWVLIPSSRAPGDGDSGHQCRVSSYFSPYDDTEDIIYEELRSAAKSVHCSLYGITNKRLAAALVGLHNTGVDVVVCEDKTQSSGAHDLHGYLRQNGIRVVIKRTSPLEHNKFCIIDDSRVIMGSWNWSRSAQKQDNSTVIISGCPEQIARFTAAWSRIFTRDSGEGERVGGR